MNFLDNLSQSKRKSLKFSLSLLSLPIAQLFCCKYSSGQVIQNQIGSPFSLFANHDLSAWAQQGNANWYIDPGSYELIANQGAGYILSRLVLVDFELKMEYWVGSNTTASLGLRCTNPYFISTDNAYLINLTNEANGSNPAGSLVGLTRALPSILKFGWNSILIKVIGNQITVVLNNISVFSNFIDNRFNQGQVAVMLASGPIKIRSLNITIPGRW